MGEQRAEKIAAAAPDVEIIDVPRADEYESPPQGDAMFAMWFEHPIFDELSATGIEWMHIPGTGVDKIPRHVFDGRTVTCSRGVSAIPIAEYVLGAMLAFEKDIPNIWLDEPPEHWNIASLGELAGKTVGIVGLGGIGEAVARAGARVRHAGCARCGATRAAATSRASSSRSISPTCSRPRTTS